MHFTMHEMRVVKRTVRPHAVTGSFELRVEGGRRSDIRHPSRCARPTENLVEGFVMGLENERNVLFGSCRWRGRKVVGMGELEVVVGPPLLSLCRESDLNPKSSYLPPMANHTSPTYG